MSTPNELEVIAGYSEDGEVFKIFSKPQQNIRVFELRNISDINKLKYIRLFDIVKDQGSFKSSLAWEPAIIPGSAVNINVTLNEIKISFSSHALITPAAESPFSEAKFELALEHFGIDANQKFEPSIRVKQIKITFWQLRETTPGALEPITREAQNFLLTNIDTIPFQPITPAHAISTQPRGFAPFALARALGLVSDKRSTANELNQLEFLFRFRKVNDTRKFIHYFEVQLPVIEATAKIKPLGFSGKKENFTFRTIGAAKASYVKLIQEQPSHEKVYDKNLGARYNFIVQFAHDESIFTWWNNKVQQPVQQSQILVNAGRSATFLPRLMLKEKLAKPKSWDFGFTVFDNSKKPAGANPKPPLNTADIEVAGADDQSKAVKIYLNTISPSSYVSTNTPDDKPGFVGVEASFDGLKTVNKTSGNTEVHKINAQIQPGNKPAEKKINEITTVDFRYRFVEYTPTTNLKTKARLQGLTMLLPEAPAFKPDLQPLEGTGEFVVQFKLSDKESITKRAANFKLSVLDFEAGKQDDSAGEEFEEGKEEGGTAVERAPAIIVPLQNKQTITGIRYQLEINENVTALTSHSINLKLNEIKKDNLQPIDTDIFIIDPEPLFIARVKSIDLGEDRLAAITNEIANWGFRAESGFNWSASISGDSYSIFLPPQAIGEEMHRYRDANDIIPGEAADMRFGQPAEIKIFTNELGQRFSELPWNTRRRLGTPGQRDPGALTKEITVELVFGLNKKIARPSLRITEIQARLGHIPAFLPEHLPWRGTTNQKNNYDNYKDSWKELLNILRSRISVLEPYVPSGLRDITTDAAGRKEYQTTTFTTDDGLTVTLDKDADLAYPFAPENRPEWITEHKDGLKGSFAWAFESINIYNALWKDTKATSARLSGLLLTPFGGSGNLRASFDHGLTTIDAIVTMGRIDRIKVERKGRISTMWNRAKHVIIYDRTVAATRQFYLEQYAYIGNVILRKTEEYVEIEQRERSFKNNNEASLEANQKISQQAGFLESCIFPGGEYPRIKVSSRWGSDIEGGEKETSWKGWKVPLWVRGAAPADVYPQPDVRLMVSTEQESVIESCVIDQPEKLFFFTLTESAQVTDIGDVESWNPIPGVDFAPIAKALHTAAANNNVSILDEASIVPGTGAFSFPVTAQKLVNLVTSRQKNAISTGLSAVTILRGPLVEDTAWVEAEALTVAKKGIDKVFNHIGPLRSQLAQINNFIEGDPLKKLFADIEGKLTVATEAYNKGVTDTFVEIKKIANAANETKKELKAKLKKNYETFKDDILEEIKFVLSSRTFKAAEDIFNIVNSPSSDPEKIRAVIRSVIDGKEGELLSLVKRLSQLRGTPGEIIAVYNNARAQVDQFIKTLQKNIDTARETIKKHLQAGRKDEAKHELQKIRAELKNLVRAIDTVLAEATQRYSRHLPTKLADIINVKRKELVLLIETQLLKVQGQIEANVADWETNLNNIKVEIGKFADEVLKRSAEELKKIENILKVDLLKNLADEYATKLKDKVEKLIAIAAGAQQFKDEIISEASKIADELKQREEIIKNFIANVDKEVEDIFSTVFLEIDKLENYFKNGLISTSEITILINEFKKLGLKPKELLGKIEDLFGEASTFSNKLVNYAQSVTRLNVKLPGLPADVQSQLMNGVKLLRAFGEAPKLPGLNFNRNVLQGVAYTFLDKKNFNEISNAVQMTKLQSFVEDPARELFNEAGNQLRGLMPVNLTFPTNELRERFEPFIDDLKKFSISDVFKNLAGIPFDKLFPNIKLPDLADKGIRVSHEFDKKTLTARVHADVNVPFEKGRAVPVFSLAGITLTLLDAALKAKVDIIVELNKPPRTRAEGEIFGNWEIKVGGYPVAEIVKTALRFDENGKIKFDLAPGNIRLKQVLQFISDFLQQLSYSDSGFTIRVTPTGVESALSLPVPDMQGAAFGIANLHVGFRLALEFLNGKFVFSTGLFAGRKTAPFTLTIFILGGAGWLETDLIYIPNDGTFKTRVSIGALASASLAISLGPVSGGIFAYFGITVEYQGSKGRADNLTVGVLIMFIGRVSLLRIIQVSMGLILQAEYRKGGGLTGRGTIFYKIKIGWFFTIKVQARVEYKFGKAKGSNTEALIDINSIQFADREIAENEYEAAMNQYLAMFED
jgi:hypothetical protein